MFANKLLSNMSESDQIVVVFNEISRLVNEAPTNETIVHFSELCHFLIELCSTPADNLEIITKLLIKKYQDAPDSKNANFRPFWQLLLANTLFSIYLISINEEINEELSIQDQNNKKNDYKIYCEMWAINAIKCPAINHSMEAIYKGEACAWLAEHYQNLADEESEKNKVTCDTTNRLIALSLKYHEQRIRFIIDNDNLSYTEKSCLILQIAEYFEKYLPENATLEDAFVKQFIRVLETIIKFHLKMCKINEASDKEIFSDAALRAVELKGGLGNLFARTPEKRGENPDYCKAIQCLNATNIICNTIGSRVTNPANKDKMLYIQHTANTVLAEIMEDNKIKLDEFHVKAEFTAILIEQINDLKGENTSVARRFITFFNPYNKSNKIAAINLLCNELTNKDNSVKEIAERLCPEVDILLDGRTGVLIKKHHPQLHAAMNKVQQEKNDRIIIMTAFHIKY